MTTVYEYAYLVLVFWSITTLISHAILAIVIIAVNTQRTFTFHSWQRAQLCKTGFSALVCFLVCLLDILLLHTGFVSLVTSLVLSAGALLMAVWLTMSSWLQQCLFVEHWEEY
ncbi:MAG: hypothetical protein V4668_01920 [Patescibacteria group bacterium]